MKKFKAKLKLDRGMRRKQLRAHLFFRVFGIGR